MTVTRFEADPAGPRTSMDVLVSLADLLERELAVLEHIRVSLDNPTEARSSCTVKTSTRGHDLEVKSYADGMLSSAVDDALEHYARGMRELTALQARQWEQTAEMVAAGALER